ncbi:hypothetical protein BDQ12DRAFT_724016 [Crucibulum laeve]|uniref:Non-specific serine/threonine protein kinase n=1 Tax=Crucibulum laeve TaxID=68775 RepID=A0A5C3LYS4_9AGAR|nr:hypothetical protein BDQ12DRAFT_724016 [Crucibulum laeve]
MSLQIPTLDSPGPAGPSSRNHPPSSAHHTQTSSTGASRPASAAVHPTSSSPNPQPPSASSRRQQRASHTVVSPSAHAQSHSHHSPGGTPAQDDSTASTTYTDVYSHPAAVAYAAAHPRRTIPKFGPYLLLQTLGEGEFGKVKLGLHMQWGEEVAVKLIRRGNVDSTVRMSKVEREIEVLRTLKHPNIVRLYDVIETDKYIGIILEYASGGELFDHILAHRYLRERDATKLFSQLISGVWYIHQKKIVHRDLKLENLLLDRHRNVIITDFGFANRFEHRADDLMQTSCGSPCYAAPELVISEGLYVGSAVDIWSCGVILYAMLAGYLPFDDDPANPDGDNINLLYKYIVNTPLSFPEYISPSAQDLLKRMLVPDPQRRASLQDVMRHPWLAQYASEFERTVDDLERASLEQHQQKRAAYQRQMRAQAAAREQAATTTSRTQSHRPEVGSSPMQSSGRSRSTQPETLYDSSMMSSPGAGDVSMTPTSNGTRKTYGSPAALGLAEDDPFAAPGSAPVANPASSHSNANNVVVTTTTTTTSSKPRTSDDRSSTLAPSQTPTKGHKSGGSGGGSGGGGFRHTIQVEYDEPKAAVTPQSVGRKSGQRERSGSQGQGSNQVNGVVQQQQQQPPTPSTGKEKEKERETTKERRPSQSSSKPLPPNPPSAGVASTPSAYRSPPPSASTASPMVNNQPSTPKVTPPTPSRTPSRHTNVPTPISAPAPDISVSSPPQTPTAYTSPTSARAESINGSGGRGDSAQNSPNSTTRKGHHKGRSVDKLGLAKIFGGGGTNGSGPFSPGETTPVSVNGKASREDGLDGQSEKESRNGGKEKEKEEAGREKPKSRRNTLTVMVEPFSRTIRNRGGKGRMTSTPVTTGGDAASVESATSKKSISASSGPHSSVLPPASAVPSSTSTAGTGAFPADIDGPGGAGMQASTNKAKKVMQWFRTKSKGRESVDEDQTREKDELVSAGVQQHQYQQHPFQQQEYKRGYSASSSTVHQQHAVSPVQVVVTTPTSGIPRPVQPPTTPGHPQRTPSSATDSSFTPSSIATRFRNSVTVGGNRHQSNAHSPASQSQIQKHPYGQLRIHHGPVDQTNITTVAPPEVMRHVKVVLEGMGVEFSAESEYKYRCVRAKRRKPAGSAGTPGSTAPGGGLAAVTMMGSAASNGVDKRGLPLPSPSTFSGTGNMLRGLLMRRQSSQVSTGPLGSSSSQPSLAFDDETSVVVNEPIMLQDTTYGDTSQDAGDEVRFSVELTRLDRLNDTFSLDIRRLKGNLRSYKFLYDTLRQRADLQRLT